MQLEKGQKRYDFPRVVLHHGCGTYSSTKKPLTAFQRINDLSSSQPKMPDIKAVGLTILGGRTAPRAYCRCICATPDRRQTQQLQQENGFGSLMKGDIQRLAKLTKTQMVKGKTDLLKHNVVGKSQVVGRVGRNGRKGHPVYYLQAQKTSKEKQFH